MNNNELRDYLTEEIYKALDSRVSIVNDTIKVTFNKSQYEKWITISMVDNRLKLGENSKVIAVADPNTNEEFMTFTHKTISVKNRIVEINYHYPYERILPSEQEMHHLKMEVIHLVNMFIAQLELNEKYLNILKP